LVVGRTKGRQSKSQNDGQNGAVAIWAKAMGETKVAVINGLPITWHGKYRGFSLQAYPHTCQEQSTVLSVQHNG